MGSVASWRWRWRLPRSSNHIRRLCDPPGHHRFSTCLSPSPNPLIPPSPHPAPERALRLNPPTTYYRNVRRAEFNSTDGSYRRRLLRFSSPTCTLYRRRCHPGFGHRQRHCYPAKEIRRFERPGPHLPEPLRTARHRSQDGKEVWRLVQDQRDFVEGSRLDHQ